MRYISLLLALIVYTTSVFSQSAPPSVKGQTDTTFQRPKPNLHLPNRQATNLGGLDTLLETGNKNRLANPGFEGTITGSTVAGWSSSLTGTATISYTAETSTFLIEGKKSLIISCAGGASGGTCTFFQDVATSQVIQAMALIYLNASSATGIKIFSRVNGVNQNSVDASTALQPLPYPVPVMAGSASTGIAVQFTVSAGNTLQAVLDEAFVGYSNIFLNTIYDTVCGTTACETTFSAKISSAGAVSDENIDWINGNCTSVTGGTCTFNSGIFTVAPTCVTVNSTSGGYSSVGVIESNTGVSIYSSRPLTETLVAQNVRIICQKQGTDYSAALQARRTFQTTKLSTYSQPYLATDRIGEIIFTSNGTAPSGFISALGSSIGQSGSGATFTGDAYYALYEHAWNIPGLTTTAGAPYRISSAKGASALADWQANKTITIDYATNSPFVRPKASSATVGSYTADSFASHAHRATGNAAPFGSTGSAVGNVGAYTGLTTANPGLTEAVGGTETAPKHVSLFAYVRFQADNQVAVLNISGLEACTDTYQCTDTYSLQVDMINNLTLQPNISGWATCSRTATGKATCTFKTGLFTQPPNCYTTLQSGLIGRRTTNVALVSSSSVSIEAWDIATGDTPQNLVVSVICQKQGADYIGKTAKAVASDQNVRSVGSVGVDIQSVYFGSSADCSTACTTGTCTICNRVGTKITSVQWGATGNYNIQGIDGTKYICQGNGYNLTSGQASFNHFRYLSSSSFASTYFAVNGVNKDVASASVTCIGIP